MVIRRAQSEDITAISSLLSSVLEIHHEGRPDIFKTGAVKYTADELCTILCDEKRPVFVAELQSGVCGYVFCMIVEHKNDNILTDIKTLYIDDLCVEEALRGKHIGKALYDYAEQYAKSIGCYNLTLNVWGENKGAYRFYENCGMTVQKTTMEKVL